MRLEKFLKKLCSKLTAIFCGLGDEMEDEYFRQHDTAGSPVACPVFTYGSIKEYLAVVSASGQTPSSVIRATGGMDISIIFPLGD
jgi:hypothetical protein